MIFHLRALYRLDNDVFALVEYYSRCSDFSRRHYREPVGRATSMVLRRRRSLAASAVAEGSLVERQVVRSLASHVLPGPHLRVDGENNRRVNVLGLIYASESRVRPLRPVKPLVALFIAHITSPDLLEALRRHFLDAHFFSVARFHAETASFVDDNMRMIILLVGNISDVRGHVRVHAAVVRVHAWRFLVKVHASHIIILI